MLYLNVFDTTVITKLHFGTSGSSFGSPHTSTLCNISSTCPHNMVNVCPLASEIGPVVWAIPANFNTFCVLAALLHARQ